MTINLRNRNFLKLLDFTPAEIRFLLELARELKAAKYAGTEQPRLQGRNIALIFEKTSTRTRCAFEVAAYDQGANVTYLGPTGTQIGVKETMKDTARVLARMYDGIEYRGFDQATVEELGRCGVPVWNGLTGEYHPTQVLADLLTMQEHSRKPLQEITFCYLGDARSNMGDSLLVGAAKMGMDFRIAAPLARQPDAALVSTCREIARFSERDAETWRKIWALENSQEYQRMQMDMLFNPAEYRMEPEILTRQAEVYPLLMEAGIEPDKKVHVQYTTTSPIMHERLGVED